MVWFLELGVDNFSMVIGRDMSVRSKEDDEMNLKGKVYEVVAPRVKRATAICELTGLT